MRYFVYFIIVHAAAGARACPSNGIWRICDFDFWHDKSIIRVSARIIPPADFWRF